MRRGPVPAVPAVCVCWTTRFYWSAAWWRAVVQASSGQQRWGRSHFSVCKIHFSFQIMLSFKRCHHVVASIIWGFEFWCHCEKPAWLNVHVHLTFLGKAYFYCADSDVFIIRANHRLAVHPCPVCVFVNRMHMWPTTRANSAALRQLERRLDVCSRSAG